MDPPASSDIERFFRETSVSQQDYFYSLLTQYLRMVLQAFPQLEAQAKTFVAATFQGGDLQL